MSDAEAPDALDLCALCGETTVGGPWLSLNRWIVGTGAGRAMIEARNNDGSYLWEMRPDGEAEDEAATGRALHWPICATQWIEGKMVECAVALRQQ
jgi:hypothetical protein